MKIQPLQNGDKIAIVAPSGALKKQDLVIGLEFLQQNNFTPIFGKNLFNTSGIGYNFSGTEQERINDFQQAIDDNEIKAIWCARGGYGAIKIIDELDFSSLKTNFKWIIGYSDITVIHNKLNQLGIPSLHAVTAKAISPQPTKESYESLKKVLVGENLSYELKLKNIHNQQVEGILIGGNLSILYSQMGMLNKDFFKDKILFIEDWYENHYHLDRMLMNFKRNGIFDSIKALIVGSFTKMDDKETNLFYQDDYDKMAYEIIQNELKNYDFPIYFGFPAGHINDNRALVMGTTLKITHENELTKFSFVQ